MQNVVADESFELRVVRLIDRKKEQYGDKGELTPGPSL